MRGLLRQLEGELKGKEALYESPKKTKKGITQYELSPFYLWWS